MSIYETKCIPEVKAVGTTLIILSHVLRLLMLL